ncbi:MAG: LysM peptidoglycan-binding domain-containing protein [Oceanipulchritudo sp.]
METRRKVKTLRRLVVLSILAGLVLGCFAACSPASPMTRETDERAYRRGKSLLREGRKEEALQAFLSVIDSRPDAAESHLEAGLLYLNTIKDPLAAIYHFRNYLALNPEGEYADFVKELILTAQKDFAQSLPGEPFSEEVERVNLMETVKALKEENNRLKQEVLQLQKQRAEIAGELSQSRQALAQRRESPAAAGDLAPIVIQSPVETGSREQAPRTYTVEAGDTLTRISSRVYGSSNRWMDIFQANQDQLESPNSLKPGQVLRIP